MVDALGRRRKIIAVDFDGTIAHDAFPDIGKAVANPVVIEWLKRRQLKGDYIILWTCRENYGGRRFPDGTYLNDAIRFCTRNELTFSNVNANMGEDGYEPRDFGRKVVADVYIDDRSLPFGRNTLLWRIYLWLMDRRLDRK